MMSPVTFREIFSTSIEVSHLKHSGGYWQPSSLFLKLGWLLTLSLSLVDVSASFSLSFCLLLSLSFCLMCIFFFHMNIDHLLTSDQEWMQCQYQYIFACCFCCSMWWSGSTRTTPCRLWPTLSWPTCPPPPPLPPFSSTFCWAAWRKWDVRVSDCVFVCVCMC